MHALPAIRAHKKLLQKNPRCVKCAAQHLTSECPRTTKDDNVKCANCHEKLPANYRGCMIHKQIQQQIYPRLRERLLETRPFPTRLTYAQAIKRQTETPQTNIHVPPTHTTNTAHTANDLIELKQMMKNLIEQMGTLINLITLPINKNN